MDVRSGIPRLGVALLLPAWGLSTEPGWDAALGIGMQRRESISFGPAQIGGSNQSPVVIRGAWDLESGLAAGGGTRPQWTAACSTVRNIECDEQTFSAGYQRVYWSREDHRTHGGIGAEIRGSHRVGKDFQAWYKIPATGFGIPPGSYYGASLPVSLGGSEVWEVRPVLRAFLGFRGLLVPFFPYFQFWKGQPGEFHSITRLEVAVPLWRQSSEGNRGLLLKLAPGPEFVYSVGVRFNPAR